MTLHGLDSKDLAMEPLGLDSCADMDRCIGVRIIDGSCVCYANGEATRPHSSRRRLMDVSSLVSRRVSI